MYTTNLRKVGGSIMLAVPPAILDILGITVDDTVGLTVESGRLIVELQEKNDYTLNELLAEYKTDSDSYQVSDQDEQEWLNSEASGRELI